MAARRYRLEIGGQVKAGLEFDSEAELEEFLIGRPPIANLASCPAPTRYELEEDVRPVGRPSYRDVIDAAIDALGASTLDARLPLRARGRLVAKQIAKAGSADEVPAPRTIEYRIAARSARRPERAEIAAENEEASPAERSSLVAK
jgi:hypothetical protein